MRMQLPQIDNPTRGRGEDRCAVCSANMTVKDSTVFVRVVEGGGVIATEDESEPDDSDLGLQPVGPECKRHIPTAYRFAG